MSSSSATGLDYVPTYVLKAMGETGFEYIAQMFTRKSQGEILIPEDWRRGRITLIPKSNSDKRVLSTYRPIKISTVLYRLFAKILCRVVQTWMEQSGILALTVFEIELF